MAGVQQEARLKIEHAGYIVIHRRLPLLYTRRTVSVAQRKEGYSGDGSRD